MNLAKGRHLKLSAGIFVKGITLRFNKQCSSCEERLSVEYMSGAVARRGNNFALRADIRIRVDQKKEGGYYFRSFRVREDPAKDVVTVVDNYPGFVVDGRRVPLKAPSRCAPYGIPSGCMFNEIGRYRKTPSSINVGKPLELRCRIADQGGNLPGRKSVENSQSGRGV